MKLIVFLIALWAPYVVLAQSPALQPFDEADKDETFLAFRESLLAAVVARDVEAIMRLADEDITMSFGVEQGHPELRAFLEVDPEQFSPEQKHEAPALRERNWAEMETVLRLGGMFNTEGEFIAPYTWAAEHPDDMDPFEVLFITGSGVALRDRPIRFGDVIRRLSYDVVSFRNWVTGTQFVEVEMDDGTTGFVHRDYARFLLDYRAVFAKKNGVWKMTYFIAGD